MSTLEEIGITQYIYGTGDVGLKGYTQENDLELLRIAIEAGIWLHSSPDYGGGEGNVTGGTYHFLRQSFDTLGPPAGMVSKLFIKGYDGWLHGTSNDLRTNAEDTCRILNIEQLPVAQIWGDEEVVADLREQGTIYKTLEKIKRDGLVGQYVWQLSLDVTAEQFEVIDTVVDGYIFYYNVIERETRNGVYDMLTERNRPIIALRTLGRMFVDYTTWESNTVDVHKYANQETPARVDALKDIYLASGCSSWLDFSMSFNKSIPQTLGTIGMTNKPSHLHDYLGAAESSTGMNAELSRQMMALQREWYT